MKFLIKATQLEILVERPYALSDTPALSYKADNYELKGDVQQLIKGINDLTKLLMPEPEPMIDFCKEEASGDLGFPEDTK